LQDFYNNYWQDLVYALLALCLFGYTAMFVKLWSISRNKKHSSINKAEIRLVFAGLLLFLLCSVLIGFIQFL